MAAQAAGAKVSYRGGNADVATAAKSVISSRIVPVFTCVATIPSSLLSPRPPPRLRAHLPAGGAARDEDDAAVQDLAKCSANAARAIEDEMSFWAAWDP